MRTTAPTSGCVTSRRPASPSSDRTTWSTSAGRPWASSAVRTASPATSAHTGVAGAGLRITADPAASAASAEPSEIATGKFHGGVTTASRTGANRAPSTPSSASACSALYRAKSTASLTSGSASAIVLPPSCAMTVQRSSRHSSRCAAAVRSTAARPAASSAAHAGCTSRLRATTRSTALASVSTDDAGSRGGAARARSARDRFAARAGSVSGAFAKGTADAPARSAVVPSAVPTSAVAPSAVAPSAVAASDGPSSARRRGSALTRDRPATERRNASSCATQARTARRGGAARACRKFSPEAASSSRRTRYATATPKSPGATTGV